jgi:hypothetical protein
VLEKLFSISFFCLEHAGELPIIIIRSKRGQEPQYSKSMHLRCGSYIRCDLVPLAIACTYVAISTVFFVFQYNASIFEKNNIMPLVNCRFFMIIFVSGCFVNSKSPGHITTAILIHVIISERPEECLSSPSSLDLDAVHCTVPKMLACEFPCKLSEIIYKEVDKTILLAEEKKKQMEVSELEGFQLQVTAPSSKGRSTHKTRKVKKSKLKHGRSTEYNDLSSPCKNDLDDFHALPDTPLPPDLQRKRNRHCSLLLSDSDDEPADRHSGRDVIFTVKEGFTQSPEGPHIHGQGILEQFPFPVESMKTFGITDSFQNSLESNMTESISQVCDTFMSQGVSCVPESSFIAGGTSASMSGDELLSGAVPNDFSTFYNGGTYTTSRMVQEDTDNTNNLITEQPEVVEDVVAETSEAYVESSCRNELASCSPAGYQLMDECSQAGSIWLFSAKKVQNCCKVEQVQDTWNRLRNCYPELPRETNHNRTACRALKLAFGVSDLLSESDLLLSCCYPLTNVRILSF